MSMVRFWFGAYDNTYEDFKGNTRYMMPLGKGAVLSYFRIEKLNV